MIKYSFKIIFVIGMSLIIQNLACAQEMYLDPNFGKNGIVTDSIFENAEFRSAVITDKNEIIVLADAYKFPSPGHITLLIKYNEDGSRDRSFGIDGYVSSPYNTGYSWIYGEMILLDDKIYVAAPKGLRSNEILVAKYNLEGQLDKDFGDDGLSIFKIDNAEDISCYSLHGDNSDEIYLGGQVTNKDDTNSALILKFNSQGKIDQGFGENGYMKYSHSKYTETRIIRTLNNQIIQIMEFNDGSYNDLLICKHDDKGARIKSFAENGCSEQAITGQHEIVHKGFSTTDDGFYLSGFSALDSIFILKFLDDGTLDASFASEGLMKVDHRGENERYTAADILIQGHIYICGGINANSVYAYKIPAFENTFDTTAIQKFELDLPDGIEEYKISTFDHDRRLILGGSKKFSKESGDQIFLYRLIVDSKE